MRPQVLTVYDIHKAIEDAGVEPFANTVVQEMSGGYLFVEAELFWDEKPVLCDRIDWDSICKVVTLGDNGTKVGWWRYKIHDVPLKLAHFIIETLRLKAQFARLGVGNIDEPIKQAVYLPPGTTIFGRDIDRLTEIPAEMGPIVVEKL